jgi:hypothetical protein
MMENIGRPHVSPALVIRPPGGNVLDRVIAIAPAPLLPGEKEADYANLVERVVCAAKPKDMIEELLTRDVIDLTWEIFRLRRAKVGILRASINTGVEAVLDGLDHGSEFSFNYSGKLAKKWATGDKGARKEVEAVLDKAGLTFDEVTAKTLESKLDSFERLDRMLASAEARRNNALREIDRHREALGGAVQQAVDEFEDAEFRDVESGEMSERSSP